VDEAREELLARLKETSERYASSVRDVESQRARLYVLIREARASGMSLREIARETGLTFARIHQITRPTDTMVRRGGHQIRR
jgi:hypothetical protein